MSVVQPTHGPNERPAHPKETEITMRVHVQVTVEASPDKVLELVMDIDRFAEVDDEMDVSNALWQRRVSTLTEVD